MVNRLLQDTLQRQIAGEVIVPGDAAYDTARRVWNGMIDRRPALIVRCAELADVSPAIAFAREHGLALSVRGGGHNIAGSAVCGGGVVIDMSKMTEVVVEPERRRAHVQPGALLGHVDAATQRHGLVTPLGINSTTESRALRLAAASDG